MTDGTKIALAIVACGVLVSGVLVWQGRLGSPTSVHPTSDPVAPLVTSALTPPPSAKDPLAGVLTNQEFMPLWEAGPDKKSKTACFEPAEKRGRSPSVLHFTVKLAAAGDVTDVTWVARDPSDDDLYKCVADVIRGMHFKARAQAAEGVVQAAKPGAFTISDAGPPPGRR